MLNVWVFLGVLVVIFVYLFIGALLAEGVRKTALDNEDIGEEKIGCFTLFVFFLWLPMALRYILSGKRGKDD